MNEILEVISDELDKVPVHISHEQALRFVTTLRNSVKGIRENDREDAIFILNVICEKFVLSYDEFDQKLSDEFEDLALELWDRHDVSSTDYFATILLAAGKIETLRKLSDDAVVLSNDIRDIIVEAINDESFG
ncbi:hypothetical protein [Mesorhizobium australicum]|uniref:hypothetical protein n=1 Tax=Mesorhizobium australicum TaxID=536018 RepID=UPI00111BD265|nr:hypothetical protein [Mesorhizobium australicum]